MADTKVPTVLVCGALIPELPDTKKRVNQALYEAQLDCINTSRPLQPVFTIEIFPMPNIKVNPSSCWLRAGALMPLALPGFEL